MRTITHIVVHHTATAGATTRLAAIDDYHHSKNWGTPERPAYAQASRAGYYTQYHYFIDWEGHVTQTRQDDEIGWHAGIANPFSLGVCLAGWFDAGHDAHPTPAQVASLGALLVDLVARHGVKPENIVPNRAFAKKTCYGLNLSDSWAREVYLTAKAGMAPLTPPYFERKIGQDTIAAYHPGSNTMIGFDSGEVYLMVAGSYDKTVKVTEWSRPLNSDKKIGFLP